MKIVVTISKTHLVCQAAQIHQKILRKFLSKPVHTPLQWLRHCPSGFPPPSGSAIMPYPYSRFSTLCWHPTLPRPADTHSSVLIARKLEERNELGLFIDTVDNCGNTIFDFPEYNLNYYCNMDNWILDFDFVIVVDLVLLLVLNN
jgi:hypothetical protein